jgi:indole-3-glycerol phosphate synthase
MILDNIASKTRERVDLLKKTGQSEQIMAQAQSLSVNTGFPFEDAIGKPDLSFICEVKKASPSKGVIAEDYPYQAIAQEYEKAGAAAISVLTEPFYFQGDNRHLADIAATVHIPVLRKDFTVDALQIYEAKCLGASAVLLIVALLDELVLPHYLDIAYSIGLSALVEAHTAKEVDRAVRSGARVVGINNRDLKTFRVDLQTSLRLRDRVPPDVLLVSESGIRSAQDIELLRQAGVDAILIGETLMRSPDKAMRLAALRGKIQ